MANNDQMMNVTLAPEPVLNPDIAKDLEAYMLAMQMLQEARQKLLAMAAQLKHMKNPMYGVMMIMNQFQEISGDQVRVLSAVDNIDSDIRAEVNDAQGATNSMSGGMMSINGKNDAEKLIEFVKQLEAFLKSQSGGNGVIDGATLKNLEDALDSIKKVFGKDWGNPDAMAKDMNTWVNESNNGTYSPELKNLQFAFQELNQSSSALSTVTNTKLQFETQMFQQFLGIDETTIQAYQKTDASMIQNQRAS